jgi:hypothetical protein
MRSSSLVVAVAIAVTFAACSPDDAADVAHRLNAGAPPVPATSTKGDAAPGTPGTSMTNMGFAPLAAPAPHTTATGSAACGACHATIFAQWSQSMHSRALTTPTMIAQTNQDVAPGLSTGLDLDKFCINCHGPEVAAKATTASLPQTGLPGADEGVACTTCHRFDGAPTVGGGGTTAFQQGLSASDAFFGNLNAPIDNNAHKSSAGVAFADTDRLCQNCHEVWLDRNGNGLVEKGIDLVLQTTWDEYLDYRAAGGTQTCASCHMQETPGLTSVSDGTTTPAPPRVVHDHSFGAVDYALDSPLQARTQAAARAALLRSSARLRIDTTGQTGVDVLVANVGAGHALPTGFAFVRQMWVELVVTDTTGREVFSSGTLSLPTDDLCDGSTLLDTRNPLRQFFQNCPTVDDSLVTFQQKLLDVVTPKVDAQGFAVTDADGALLAAATPDSTETWLQFITGGVIPRARVVDGTDVPTLAPLEERRFHYDLGVNASGLRVTARLLYRAMAPYFLRALGNGQPPAETPRIAPLVDAVEVVEMARDEAVF